MSELTPLPPDVLLPKEEIFLHRHSAAIQAGCALLGFVVAIVTLVYLVRYSNDTRILTQLSQKQFADTQIENRAHRLLEYERLLNEDNAEMPNLAISNGSAPKGVTTDAYVFLTIINFGSGDASDFALFDQTAQKLLFGGDIVKAHIPLTVSIPKSKLIEGHVLRLIYSSPHGSVRQQTIVFVGKTVFTPLGDTISRPYKLLVENSDYTTFAPGDKKNTPGVIFGIGPPPGP